MKALCPCHWSTPKSASKSSVSVYQGMSSQPMCAVKLWISACGARETYASVVVPRVQVSRGGNLVGAEGAADAGSLRVGAARRRLRSANIEEGSGWFRDCPPRATHI